MDTWFGFVYTENEPIKEGKDSENVGVVHVITWLKI
jgi:hypothetical protein